MATLLESNTSTLASGSLTTNDPTANSLEKKPRKKRVPKQSKLEQLGWDTSLSWSFPRFKKYINDPKRKACSMQAIIHFKTSNDADSDTSGSHDGVILTFERGPRIDQLCIITKFSPTWIAHPEFQKLIERFTSTSKSSRFVLISTEAKSWGKSKVAVAKEMLKTVLVPFKEETYPATKIIDLGPVDTPSNPTTPPTQKIKIVPKKAPKKRTIKKKNPLALTIDTRIEKVKNKVSSPSFDSETDDWLDAPRGSRPQTISELHSILVDFNTQIAKVNSAFTSLKKSVESVEKTSYQIGEVMVELRDNMNSQPEQHISEMSRRVINNLSSQPQFNNE